ncbi:MAG: TolC family protein, partial [Chitinophagaceae bacterium]|nr:TolC family protein [Chitinophagaceae bacterium]
KLRKMKEAARARYLASEQGMKLVQSMLTAQTTMLYYELVALDNESKIVAENIALQERAVAIVEAQKAGGRATELAVQQFKAQLYNTQSSAYNIVQKRTEVINKLNTLAGRYEGDIVRADKLNILEHFDQSVQVGLPIQILENRPDVLAAQSELKAAKADVGAARAAFFPSLNIAGYAAFNAFNGNLLFSAGSLGYQLFGGVMAPIFQKRQIRTQYNMANASQEQAFFQYQKTVLNAYQEVSNSISAIENTQKSFLLKEKETKALAQGVEISNDLYVTGYASYLEIVAAQKSKLEAELELVILEQNKIFRLVDLYQALGGGWQ